MEKIVYMLALTGLLTMSACQQRGDEASAPGGESATLLQVTEVRILATEADKALPQPQTTKMPVVLEIRTRGSSGGLIEAKLINLKTGQQVGLIDRRIAVGSPGSTRLTFKNPSGWNAGRYLIEIKLDGRLVEQRDFDIFDPPQ